jgi:ankyrin repeat protein
MVGGLSGAGVDFRLADAVKQQKKETVRALLKEGVDVNATHPDGTTALAWAVYHDDLEMAELLIRGGANANLANDLGVGPLSLAATNRNPVMVEKLLVAGANPNVSLWSGETPLMTAAKTGNLDVAKQLIARGADLNAKEKRRGETALMWAIAAGHRELSALFIDKGADIRASTHEVSGTEAYRRLGWTNDVVRVTPEGGYTALLFAARTGDLDTARLLVARGADVNEATKEDGSALIIASRGGFEDLALFLLEKGADPKATDGSGVSAMHYAVRDGLKVLTGGRTQAAPAKKVTVADAFKVTFTAAGVVIEDDEPPATTPAATSAPAAPRGARGAAARAAAAADPDPDADQGGFRRGGVLAGSNMHELLKALLVRGVDANVRMREAPALLRTRGKPKATLSGATPFLLAAASADLNAMAMLLEYGANPKLKTEFTDDDPMTGRFVHNGSFDYNYIQGNVTPLLGAAGINKSDRSRDVEAKDLETIKVLLNLGADINEASVTGWTALHAAAFTGATTIVRFLAENGANIDARNGCGQTALTLAAGSNARGLLVRPIQHKSTADALKQLGASSNPSTTPVGTCLEGRLRLENFTFQEDGTEGIIKRIHEEAETKVDKTKKPPPQ